MILEAGANEEGWGGGGGGGGAGDEKMGEGRTAMASILKTNTGAEWEDGDECSPGAAAQTEGDTWRKQTLVIALDSPGAWVI